MLDELIDIWTCLRVLKETLMLLGCCGSWTYRNPRDGSEEAPADTVHKL